MWLSFISYSFLLHWCVTLLCHVLASRQSFHKWFHWGVYQPIYDVFGTKLPSYSFVQRVLLVGFQYIGWVDSWCIEMMSIKKYVLLSFKAFGIWLESCLRTVCQISECISEGIKAGVVISICLSCLNDCSFAMVFSSTTAAVCVAFYGEME